MSTVFEVRVQALARDGIDFLEQKAEIERARGAARVALEWQPVATWREKALASGGDLAGLTARLVHPLWVGERIDVRGETQQPDGRLKIWAADKNGTLCGEMDLEFAR